MCIRDSFHRIKFPFNIGYGMTECGPLISYAPWNEFVTGVQTCALPISCHWHDKSSAKPPHPAKPSDTDNGSLWHLPANVPKASSNIAYN